MKLYSATWCSACAEVEVYLHSKNVAYEKIDIDSDETAEKKVRALLKGELSLPVLVGCNDNYATGFLPSAIQALIDKCH